MEWLQTLVDSIQAHPWLQTTVYAAGLALAAALADYLTQRILVRVAARIVRASPMKWDDALLARGVGKRLSHVVPALVVYAGIVLVPGLADGVVAVTRNVAAAYMVVTVAQAISALLAALGDIYDRADPVRARSRPIKGYLQVAKIVLFVVAAVLVVAVLIERSPLLLLSGLGAMTAVVLLVFKDTILSLVASVQLTSNDMVRVGDWIEMPQFGADGEVVDVALHTVKVQNWDKTITTVPTYRLIHDSFRNWRGMNEAGGRRIMRALSMDQGRVRYLDSAEREALSRFVLLRPYLERKQAELEKANAEHQGCAPVNLRRLTNLGTFRAYATAYVAAHPGIHPGMTQMVRQRAPGPQGLPIEIYCFTRSTDWGEYESVQADIFDHLLAILPEFGLRAFQAPSGADVWEGLQSRGFSQERFGTEVPPTRGQRSEGPESK
jgi:miniconductance mechanosensitive channel